MTARLLAQALIDPAILTCFNDTSFPDEWHAVAATLQSLADPDAIRTRHALTREALLPNEFLDELFQVGAFSLLIPKERGGGGATMRAFGEVVTALAQVDASAAVTLVPHTGMGVKSLLLFGSDEQKERLLNQLQQERRIVAFALTEPEAGSDVANHHCRLTTLAPGRYRLDGEKTWITNGSWAKTLVVCAKCPDLSKIPGGSVFVELKPDDPGLRITNPYHKLGLPGSATSQLVLDGVEVADSRLMGTPGKAVQHFNQLVDTGRMGVAAGALGLLRRAWREAAPLLETAMAPELWLATATEWEAELAGLHALIAMAARAHDCNAPDLLIDTALAKQHLSDRCWQLLSRLRELLGPVAFFSGALEALWCDAPVLRITEGPNEVLLYRAGLDLVMSLHRPLAGAARIEPLLRPELTRWSALFDLNLQTYSSFIKQRVTLQRSFLERQLELEAFCQGATSLLIFQGLLLLEEARLAGFNALAPSWSRSTAHLASPEQALELAAKNCEQVLAQMRRKSECDFATLEETIMNSRPLRD